MTADDLVTAPQNFIRQIKITVWLTALTGWIGLVFILWGPVQSLSEGSIALSSGRLALAFLQLALSGALSWLLIRLRGDDAIGEKLYRNLQNLVKNDWYFRSLTLGSFALFSLIWILLFLPEMRAIALFQSLALYLPGLKPFLLLPLVIFASIVALALMARYSWAEVGSKSEKQIWQLAGIIFFAMLFLWGISAFTGFGLGFDISEWNAPGAPILFSQIVIALSFAIALSLFVGNRVKGQSLDRTLFLLIWLASALLWNSIEAAPTYYSSPAMNPAQQSFPLSDAFNHDVIANNVLIGEGFRFGDLHAIRKPVYVAFLAVLHVLSDSNYEGIVQLQVFVLALFPALLFLLGSKMHSRIAGLILAVMIILRESNALLLGDVINLSHAKLLMADFPAALGMAALTLLGVHTIQKHRIQAHWLLLLGGAMGLLLLLRSQQITVILFLLIYMPLLFHAWGWKARNVALGTILLVFGILLSAGPWLLRNKSLTGEWIIEQSTAASFLAVRYSEFPEQVETRFLPDESEGEYYARHMAIVKQSILERPIELGRIVADNYFRNLYLTVLPLPLSMQLFWLEDHVREQSLWPSWAGELPAESIILLAINLSLIALGLAAAWRQVGWSGLLPIVVLLGFSLNLALARVSGWRYNQVVDWIAIMYFAIGLGQIIKFAYARLRPKKDNLFLAGPRLKQQVAHPAIKFEWPNMALITLALLAIAYAPLASEALIPKRYQENDEAFVIETIARLEAEQQIGFQQLLGKDQFRPIIGRALYPRYFTAGEGEDGRDFPLISKMDMARITLYIVGPEPSTIILPINGPIQEWASGMDSIAFVCKNGSGWAAGLIIFNAGGQIEQSYLSEDQEICQ